MKIDYTQEQFDKAKSRDLLPILCKECGKRFFRGKNIIKSFLKPNSKNKGDFCSIQCNWRNIRNNSPKIQVICINCDNKITLNKGVYNKSKNKNFYCNHSCAATYQNNPKTHGIRISKLEIWLSTQLTKLYPNIEFHFNRKDAINSELDIYLPRYKLAFELNGIFHYEPIYGEKKLTQTKNNDNRKFQACIENKISLCIIDSSKMISFKEKKAQPYLDIITYIINDNINNENK